jgi:glycosyltransferase involved in cell wall biosynthesis
MRRSDVSKRVTVVICAYNRTDFLRESLQSVLNQTYKDIRIVVLDDCSTEDVESVVRSFDDGRIEYIRNEKNLGLVGNWNKAFEVCDTEYLNIFHDDDRMFPWMIEKLVWVLDNNPNVVVALSGKFFTLESSAIPSAPEKMNGLLYEKGEFVRNICSRGANYVVCPSAFFRKRAIDSAGMFFRDDVGLAADLYFWLEANSKGLPLYILNSPLLEYRVHPGSFSNTSGSEKWIFTHKRVEDLIKGMNIGCDTRKLQETFGMMPITLYVRREGEDFDPSRINDLRRRLQEDLGWTLSDKALNEAVAVGYLGESITAVAKGQAGCLDYLKKQRELHRRGFPVPIKRQIKWFLKYVLAPKITGKKL